MGSFCTPSRIFEIVTYRGTLDSNLDSLLWMLLDFFWASSGIHDVSCRGRRICFYIWDQILSADWPRNSLFDYISLSAISKSSNTPFLHCQIHQKKNFKKKKYKKKGYIQLPVYICLTGFSIVILIWLADLSVGHMLRYLYPPTYLHKSPFFFSSPRPGEGGALV